MRESRPTRAWGWSAAIGMAVAACGGATPPSPAPPPPPPAPVVTTVEVSPATPTIVIGDSAQLAVTIKDQNGNPVSGKTPTWASSAVNVTTISSSGLIKAVAQGTATITATVDGKSGTAQVTVPAPLPLDLDPSRTSSDSIGPQGGTLTAAGANGVSYTFVIPPHALQAPHRITMTPVKGMGRLPFSGGLLGGVDFQPAGLRLAVPGSLRMVAPGPRPPGLTLVGFSYQGQADSLTPVATADSTGSVTVLVSHFSGVGGGFGTSLEVQTFLATTTLSSTSTQFYLNELISLASASPRNFTSELQVMRDWMAQVIVPGLQNATNDFALVLAMGEYNMWRQTPIVYGITGASAVLAPERAAAGAAAAPRLRQAIAGNNTECAANQDEIALSNVLFWQTQAEDLGVDTAVEQLDRRTVLAGLCGQVIFTQLNFPANPATGQGQTLDAQVGFKWGTNPNLDFQQFSWQVDIQGSDHDGLQQGLADLQGKFSIQVAPTGSAPLTMVITMCLMNSRVPYFDVCASQQVVRLFGVTVTGNITIASQQGLATLANVSKIIGSLSISGGPSFSTTDLRELNGLAEVTSFISITGMPLLTSLDGIKNLTKLDRLVLSNNPQLAAIHGLTRLQQLNGLFSSGNPKLTKPVIPLGVSTIPGLVLLQGATIDSLDGFLGVQAIGQLWLLGVGVRSLSPLRRTTVSGISIQNAPNLTSLNGLIVPPVMNFLAIAHDPALTDISALAPVRQVISSIMLGGSAFTSLAPLAGLTRVSGSVFLISGPGGGTFALPGLTQAVGLDVTVDNTTCALFDVKVPALASVGFFDLQSISFTPAGCGADLDFGNVNVNATNALRQMTFSR